MGDDKTVMLMMHWMDRMTTQLTGTLSSTLGTTGTTGTSGTSDISAELQEISQLEENLWMDEHFDRNTLTDTEAQAARDRISELQQEINRTQQLGETQTAVNSLVDSVSGIIGLLDELGVIDLPETRNGTTATTWLTAIGDQISNTVFSCISAWGGKSSEDSEGGEAEESRKPSDVKYSEISGTNTYGINQNAWNSAGLDPATFASFDTDGSGYVSYMEYVQGGGKR